MTLDQIETFLSVADEGSFKAASSVLSRSQHALSVSVKKLEEELGVELFSRDAYRPSLTPSGRAFYNRAKDFFHSSQTLERFGMNLGLGLEPEVNIALDGLVSMNDTLQMIEGFVMEYRDTKLNFSQEVLGGTVEKVRKGMVQMAIGPNFQISDTDFKSVPFKAIELTPVVHSSLIERYKIKNLSAKELKKVPQVIVRDSRSKDDSLNHGILKGARQWSVQDMQSRRDIIYSGLGWGRLPGHMIGSDIEKGDLIEIEVGHIKRIEIQTSLFCSEYHPLGPLATKLWNIFSAEASS
jgi:DNA-binding transcriptional LysR family regulator